MVLSFTNIFAEILLRVLGYRVCVEHHILGHFSEWKLPMQKLPCFGTKYVGEIDPREVNEVEELTYLSTNNRN